MLVGLTRSGCCNSGQTTAVLAQAAADNRLLCHIVLHDVDGIVVGGKAVDVYLHYASCCSQQRQRQVDCDAISYSPYVIAR